MCAVFYPDFCYNSFYSQLVLLRGMDGPRSEPAKQCQDVEDCTKAGDESGHPVENVVRRPDKEEGLTKRAVALHTGYVGTSFKGRKITLQFRL